MAKLSLIKGSLCKHSLPLIKWCLHIETEGVLNSDYGLSSYSFFPTECRVTPATAKKNNI